MDGIAESVDFAAAGEFDQPDGPAVPRFESCGGARGNVQPPAVGGLPVKLQRRVGFGKVIVRADLDRPVAGVGHGDLHRLTAGIDHQRRGAEDVFSRNH